MNSLNGKLAAAIVAQLNSASFDLEFEAVMGWAPVYKLKELKTLRVTVCPRQVQRSLEARKLIRQRLQVDVAVQQFVTVHGEDVTVRDEEVDALIALTEAIADHLDTRALGETPGAVFHWVDGQHLPILLPDQLMEQHVLTSVLSLTYQISKAVA